MPYKRNKGNKQKTHESSIIRPMISHIKPSNNNGCVKSGFTVVKNDGIVSEKNEHYRLSCFFKSISDYLCLVRNNISAIKIRNIICFPKTSIEVDTVTHANYIQNVCNIFKISIAFFTVNLDSSNNSALWIGNPAVVFEPFLSSKSSKVSIASYGAHYELIVSETPFSPNLTDKCKHYNVKTHKFDYNYNNSVFTENGQLKMTYTNAVLSESYRTQELHIKNQISRVDLELQLRNTESDRIKQESVTEMLKCEINSLNFQKKSGSIQCRLKCLNEMIKLSIRCSQELSDNIIAIKLQLQLC